jgi:hypothetical protein
MQSLIKGAPHAAERLTVTSALNPLLWLCGILTPLLLTAAFYFDGSNTLRSFCGPLVYVALGLVVLTALAGQQALLLIQQSNTSMPAIDPAHIVALAKSVTPRR